MDINKKIELLSSAILEDTKIVSVTYVSGTLETESATFENLSPFYRIEMESSPEEGSFIRTELWLPENWNNVFVGMGNGGIAGTITHGALAEKINEGYAAANTDLGTSRGAESGINNPAVWKDFGWRATHIMTVISKTLIRIHYEKDADYSYFMGWSTGGEQSLSLAQRFPCDYDGILAGVPANNRIFLHTYFVWNFLCSHTPSGEAIFTVEDCINLQKCSSEFFSKRGDGKEGDNFVSLPENDEATIDAYIDFLRSENKGFSEEKLNALKKIYSGPSNPKTGEKIYCGMPIGSEACGGGLASYIGDSCHHFYPFNWVFGKDYTPYDFDFDTALDKVSDALSAHMNANNADLSKFEKNGGKLMIYSGSSDPLVPFPDAMHYYERVCSYMGGYDSASKFVRYFLMPGKDHGSSGPGTNRLMNEDKTGSDLYILRKWREEGIAPDLLIAQKVDFENNKVVFERTIYHYNPEKGKKICPQHCSDKYLQA